MKHSFLERLTSKFRDDDYMHNAIQHACKCDVLLYANLDILVHVRGKGSQWALGNMGLGGVGWRCKRKNMYQFTTKTLLFLQIVRPGCKSVLSGLLFKSIGNAYVSVSVSYIVFFIQLCTSSFIIFSFSYTRIEES